MTSAEPYVAQHGEPTDDEPFALELNEFIELRLEPPEPLLGTKRNTILPVGGLAIVAGKEGIGKTTLIIDLAFHLASGEDWLGFEVPGPVNVLIVENEGPQHAFRIKLQEKVAAWQPTLAGRVFIQTWSWGGFSFREKETSDRARQFLDEHEVDVIIGDPLDSLGVEGVGSPEDVRKFIEVLVPLGLKTDRAFVLLHHLAHHTEGSREELEQISGVWGRPADALITVKRTHRPDQIRINPVKLRHARDTLKPVVVGLVRETGGFERLGEEGDARLLEDEIVELLEDEVWRTAAEIAEKAKGGIGSRRKDVEECLGNNGYLFAAINGREIIGKDGKPRSGKATLWQLLANKDLRPEAPTAPESDGNGGQADLWQNDPEDVITPRDESGQVDSGEPDPWE